MNAYLLIFLRFVHVVAGLLWAGAAIFYFFFVKPTVKAIGPAGSQFMQQFVGRQKYPLFMQGTSLFTLLAGGVLFWYTSGGFNTNWFVTGPGIGFTLGSLVGIFAFLLGSLMIGPRAKRMGELGAAIGKGGGRPTQVQAAELQKLDQEMILIERIEFVFLLVSLITMATARYWIL